MDRIDFNTHVIVLAMAKMFVIMYKSFGLTGNEANQEYIKQFNTIIQDQEKQLQTYVGEGDNDKS